jgi:MHS family proline/betaine transporter-like MFS transporter
MNSFIVICYNIHYRPIGGMMMGYIGDKYGSRKALTISIFLMAFPTVSVNSSCQ